ncbi:Telomere length regulation protein TEL2 -like protein [Echinococcus granulosus]|uniref:Telomere length regulation protein tel2 n=1 Tax=Echinococcus granulosus TaxID=6210 RepID=A0A068WBR2_ECHGR|nr:Telomere length regulation protein TEL2 -like protein [Echinococcus granulosus]CDS15828.1 telomere length regulation protein tel2 [Echinococcus granulosus]
MQKCILQILAFQRLVTSLQIYSNFDFTFNLTFGLLVSGSRSSAFSWSSAYCRRYAELRKYLSAPDSAFESLSSQTIFLSKLAAKLFSNPTLPSCYDLLLFATSKARADIWFEVLVLRLQQNGSQSAETKLCLSLLLKYLLEFRRLPQLLFAINDMAICISSSVRYAFLVEKTRRLINLPTLITNSLKTTIFPRPFEPKVYFPLIIRHATEVTYPLLNAVLISQSCLLGFGKEVWSAILQQVSRSTESSNTWSRALSLIQERALEATLVPLLSQASHPHLVTLCLSSSLRSPMQNRLFRLFHRLLIFRRFSSPRVPINIFGFLSENATADLITRVENDLGLHLLQCWSDSTALRSTSSQNRIYLNQALVTWVSAFQDSIINSPSYSKMISYVLHGITVHLACNFEEQRVLGMAVGEWLIEQFHIGRKGIADENLQVLKFEYVENGAVKLVKPLFEPIPPYQLPENQVDESVEGLFAIAPSVRLTNTTTKANEVDSDDDLEENEMSAGFQPLPEYTTSAPCGWPFRARRPHYLRECLDGLGGAKHNPDDIASNEVALSCFAHAEELIYRHCGGAVHEVAAIFADTLLHTEPPICPYIEEVNASRHRALVALAVVSPRRTVHYLTGQLMQSGLAVNQLSVVIAALTDAACCLGPKFTPVAGDFFFPTLRAAGVLLKRQPDVYAHLDDAVLARLLTSLGVMYACGRNSPMLPRMAEELLTLSPLILTNSSDPAVRRSFLSTLNVMLTITPPSVFTANHELLLIPHLAGELVKTLQGDPDSGCQHMAEVALCFLREHVAELIGVDFSSLVLKD